MRGFVVVMAVVLGLGMLAAPAGAGRQQIKFSPGSAGIGDSYFPSDGNGGYDVSHYDLDIRYDPGLDRLTGIARITATARQNLSRFNLDFRRTSGADGMQIGNVRVQSGSAAPVTASWTRKADELIVTPPAGLPEHTVFTVSVEYAGEPLPNSDAVDGFIHTADGAIVMGEPHSASSWYPVNDHPSDKASYEIRVTVPETVTPAPPATPEPIVAVSNGVLVNDQPPTIAGFRTWHWRAAEPMASYLTMLAIGNFDLSSRTVNGISYLDAIDPSLDQPPTFSEPMAHLLTSQMADISFKRLTRIVEVPPAGADLTFEMIHATEPGWDYAFVEAHTPGQDDWTTLEDENGNTTSDVGDSCPNWHKLHPFLTHYQKPGAGTCAPTGSTGQWFAATGTSEETEHWLLNLDRYAGGPVEVSISYASDEFVQGAGVFVDNITVSTGAGSTSFENGADLAGWTVAAPPPGSPDNPNSWTIGTPDDLPQPGVLARATFERQPDFIDFLEGHFGPYPFAAAGGLMDDHIGLDSSLETQTRPIYAREHFSSPEAADLDVVHELAHQWFGNSVTIDRWRDIWLNEGFATYAEWLWTARHDPRELAKLAAAVCAIPAADDFWKLKIGDPGPDHLFDDAIYRRGALTLYELGRRIGEPALGQLLREWADLHRRDFGSTDQFIELAVTYGGADVRAFLHDWLFTKSRPSCDT